jgi:hypothetical protein
MTAPYTRKQLEEIAGMEANAAKLHAEIGTTAWDGLDNSAKLPSADWVPDTSALRIAAERALNQAPTPALRTWAEVRAAVTDAEWNRILGDLRAGPNGQREQAICQVQQ